MKHSLFRRTMCLVLSLVLLLGTIPLGATAAEEGAFVLVAEAGGALVIAPEYIPYTSGQTVREALAASGHRFTDLSEGWITEIDGISGNYTRSDENGGFDLDAPASAVAFYRFSEDLNSQPSEGLKELMSAMADYCRKPADVKAAARDAYDTAYAQFVGLESLSAHSLAEALNSAISVYEESQRGTLYSVTFTDGSTLHTNAEITAENAYGKVWQTRGDGVLQLPAGSYTFHVRQDGLHVEGSITVSGSMTVNADLPRELYLDLSAFRLSGSYGADDNENSTFRDDEYVLSDWNGRSASVTVPDTFTGKIYTCAAYRKDLFTAVPSLTAIYTNAQTGQSIEQSLPFASLTSGCAGVLTRGATGNTVTYRVSTTGSHGYIYSQDYTVTFCRLPSLASLQITDQRGVDQTATEKFSGDVHNYTYKVVDTVTAVTVQASPLDSSYQVTVNGQAAGSGVTVPVSGKETTITVEVRAQGFTSTYLLTILPGEGKKLSFVTDRSDVTLEVVNSNGEVLPFEKFREGTSGNRYQYVLVPGETYSYVATANTYYHVADSFTMEDVADSTIRVDVPTEDYLQNLSFGTRPGSTFRDTLALNTAFRPELHSYSVSFVDTEHYAYLWITAVEGVTAQVFYRQKYASGLYHDREITLDLNSGSTTGLLLKRFLMDENPVSNTATLRLKKEEEGIAYYQDYVIEFTRTLTLKELSAQCAGIPVIFQQENGSTGFDPQVQDYTLTVSMASTLLDLSVLTYSSNLCYGETEVGYRVKVNGKDVTGETTVQLPLSGTMETETVVVTVENPKAPGASTTYTLQILKSPPVRTVFDIQPEHALLMVVDKASGQRMWPEEDGSFLFCEDGCYSYTLTRYGYVGQSGTLQVLRDETDALVIRNGENTLPVQQAPEGGGEVTVTCLLEKAPENPGINPGLPAQWGDFRGNPTNNGVVDSRIPTSADSGTLYWANQIGSGIDADAVGSPILVNGELITYASDKIFRIDTVTGEILKTGTMDHKSSFSITPPVYAQGMVFVALSSGTVQAFNAETLESLWIYNDPLEGQPNCPLTVHNGYLYTGFWNSETGDANFVCLSITDEDPQQEKEAKCASWYYTAKGGFYWAGAYVCDEFLLVGTDDGTSTCTSPTSSLLVLDPVTGAILDRWDGLNGDIRSTVVYDTVSGNYCFTSKGGSFYCLQMENCQGRWQIGSRWSLALENGSTSTPMSTCSPVVYNGRAYIGVSGAGQFSPWSGHNITVIDLNEQKIAYRAQTQGYPQTSGLLTTAYASESGYVYIYFFDNMTPGTLRVLRDKPGQTSADYLTSQEEHQTLYSLFTPTGDQAQYAICSPISDEYGTIYFKNDSAHLMAFGSAIEKIEITQNPNRMEYADGETFDPTGMVVTATYCNGMTRDVTAYVTLDTETVTGENPVITISFPHVLYHNEENGTAMNSGVASTTPTVTLELTVSGEDILLGDVNGDGKINIKDRNLVVAYFTRKTTLTDKQLKAADVNGDGKINIKDANLISAYFSRKISVFPGEK